ncbi:uncharacterized protein [Oscarella lobularis]|uniref:uncharacterized protein n=1 Tax=Oscarella lobularis TaxID=121494 RepID=UPI0033140909
MSERRPPRPALPDESPPPPRPPPPSAENGNTRKPSAKFYVERPPDVPPLPVETTAPTQKKLIRIHTSKGPPPARKVPERPPPSRPPPTRPEQPPRPPPSRPAPPRVEINSPERSISPLRSKSIHGRTPTPPRQQPSPQPGNNEDFYKRRSASVRVPSSVDKRAMLRSSSSPPPPPSVSSPPPTSSGSGEQSPKPAACDDVEKSPKMGRKSTMRRVMGFLGKKHPDRNALSESAASDLVSDGSPAPDEDGPDNRGEKKTKRFGFSLKVKKEKKPVSLRSASHAIMAVSRAQPRAQSEQEEDGALSRLVAQCLGYLNRPHILKEEGLFRISGDVAQINELKAKFIAGHDVNLNEVLDPNTVTGLLKQYFKYLRKPIVALGAPQKTIMEAVRQKDADGVKSVLAQVPIERYSSLQIMIEIFSKVAEYSEENKMSSDNLALSCGMSLFNNMSANNSKDLLRYLIDNKEQIFT